MHVDAGVPGNVRQGYHRREETRLALAFRVRVRPGRSGVYSSRKRTDRARVRMWNDAALPDVSQNGFGNRGSISRAARHADVPNRHRITPYVDRHTSRVVSRFRTFSRPSASNSAPKLRRRGMPGQKYRGRCKTDRLGNVKLPKTCAQKIKA